MKICQANQLKEEQQKSVFDLRTDETSAAQYFQVHKHMIDYFSYFVLLTVVWPFLATTEHVTGKNLIPQSYGNVINHRIMYVLLPTSQHFYRTVKCLRTR